jgi:hypothetical protein
MPFITVKVANKNHKINAEELGNEISEKSGLELSRLNLVIQYMDETIFYRGSGSNAPAVVVEASLRNGKDFIQNLTKASAIAVENHLNLAQNSVAAFAHPIQEGYLFLDGDFK